MKSSEHPNYIVPLNLAKKLKRIGFKDKVNFYYSFHISNRGVHITGIPENMNKKYYSGKYISLPSYEQVFSWFRRKGFYITLESHRENTKFTFYIKSFFSKYSITALIAVFAAKSFGNLYTPVEIFGKEIFFSLFFSANSKLEI